ncbi:MAG TPA: hypothetical protein VIU33_02645 [Nitrospiria bacterium]
MGVKQPVPRFTIVVGGNPKARTLKSPFTTRKADFAVIPTAASCARDDPLSRPRHALGSRLLHR